MTTLVCNTGPIIALGKLDYLSLLDRVGFDRVVIPPAVRKELLAKMGPETDAIEQALGGILQVREPAGFDHAVEEATGELDQGERQVVLLGASLGSAALLLLDDQVGRRAARTIGLRVLGTAGLLLLAKREGHVDAIVPLLERLRASGYWLSDILLAEVRKRASE